METKKSWTSPNPDGRWRQWFTGVRGIAICAIIAIGLLILFLGHGSQGDIAGRLATLVALLLVLACPAMMLMCMKNMNANHQDRRNQPPR